MVDRGAFESDEISLLGGGGSSAARWQLQTTALSVRVERGKGVVSTCSLRVAHPSNPACLRPLREPVSMGTRSPPTLFAAPPLLPARSHPRKKEREKKRERKWNEPGIQMGEPSSVSRLSRNVARANFLRSLANRFPSGRCSVCRVHPLPSRDTAGFPRRTTQPSRVD